MRKIFELQLVGNCLQYWLLPEVKKRAYFSLINFVGKNKAAILIYNHHYQDLKNKKPDIFDIGLSLSFCVV